MSVLSLRKESETKLVLPAMALSPGLMEEVPRSSSGAEDCSTQPSSVSRLDQLGHPTRMGKRSVSVLVHIGLGLSLSFSRFSAYCSYTQLVN